MSHVLKGDQLTSRELELVNELIRVREVLNNYVHNLCHGLDPTTEPLRRHFGSQEHRLFEIFAVMGSEVVSIGDALVAQGIEPDEYHNGAAVAERLEDIKKCVLNAREYAEVG